MHFARRAHALKESATLRVTRKAAELRARGRPIISFGAGESDFDSPAVAVEAARRALAEGFTRYTSGSGIPDLRAALARQFNERWGAEYEAADVIVTVGGKAGLFALMMVLLDSGDQLVMSTPSWVSFEAQAAFAGGEVVTVPASIDDRFAIHAAPLIDAITDRTRVVLVNSPSNPTGGVIGEDDLGALVEACADRGISLLADETYDRFVYGDVAQLSAARWAAKYPETVIVVGSFSKTYAMTGWRVGYCLGPRAVIDKVGALQSHMTSNPTSFAMKGALAALEGAEPEVERMLAVFSRRRELITDRLAAIDGVRVTPPSGAFYVLPDVTACYRRSEGKIGGSVDLADYLLEEAGVAVVPGIAFGTDDHIRLSFACSEDEIERGLERMAEALGRLPP